MNQEESPCFRIVSECTIKPKHVSQDPQKIRTLTPWELSSLSTTYIRLGLLYNKPETPINFLIDHLRDSLSTALTHFPSLTGRFVTQKDDKVHIISLDCTNPQGIPFIHAIANDVTISDVLSPKDDIPRDFNFYPPKGAVCYDGHTMPMVIVQVTELVDGVFIAPCVSHSVVDGTSFWHFFNTWAEICREKNLTCLSNPPKTWCMEGLGDINLPFAHKDEFIKRPPATQPNLRERVFHFPAKFISQIKASANKEANTTKISSFQALTAFLWRCTTRARKLADDQVTICAFSINDRARLNPPLSDSYFGNYVQPLAITATAGQILGNNIGWSAWKLHEAIASHTDEKIRTWVKGWEKNPCVHQTQNIPVPITVAANSPRFDVFGNDFGWGRPLGMHIDLELKFDGDLHLYHGREEKGSIAVDVCLSQESMTQLLLDDEFMGAVSQSVKHHATATAEN